VRIGNFFGCFRVVIIKVQVLYRNYLVTYLRNDFKIGFYRESSRYFKLKSLLTQKKVQERSKTDSAKDFFAVMVFCL